MRTFIFITTFILVLFLTSLGTQAQTEYRIDQQLPGDIRKIQVFSGWDVRLIYDTVNMLSIATPCEYYFAEGNEPQICRQHADGWLSIWKNTSMPKGTVVEVHYRHSLQRLDVHPGATVSADTLLMFDATAHIKDSYGDINVNRGATLRVKEVRCRREIGKPGFLAISADTASTVRIGTVRAGYLSLWSQQDATLMLDSIDAHEVVYHRDPKAHDNLWQSDPKRNIKVKTRRRWFAEGLKQLDNTIGIAFSSPFLNSHSYNSPYLPSLDMTVIVGLKTNIIPINQRFGLSLGLDYGIPTIGLANNSILNGRMLEIDTVSPGVNRSQMLMYMYLGIPVRLHYNPITKFGQAFFNDIHLGLEPRVNFYQRYARCLLGTDNRWHYITGQPGNHALWANNTNRVDVYNPLQLRADLGWRVNHFTSIEFNFYFDLLPTYRKGIGMDGVHAFGFQIQF